MIKCKRIGAYLSRENKVQKLLTIKTLNSNAYYVTLVLLILTSVQQASSICIIK